MDVYMASQEDSDGGEDAKTFQSIQIEGLEIYRTNSKVEDIQVECAGGGVKIWLFLASFQATRLSIYAPRYFKPVERYIGADGLVHQGVPARTADVKGKTRSSGFEEEVTSKRVKFFVFE